MVRVSLARSFQGSQPPRRTVAAKLYADRAEEKIVEYEAGERSWEQKWTLLGDGSITYSCREGDEDFRVAQQYPPGTVQRFAWCGFIGVAIKNLYQFGNGSLDAAFGTIALLGNGDLEDGIRVLMYLAKVSRTDIDTAMRAVGKFGTYLNQHGCESRDALKGAKLLMRAGQTEQERDTVNAAVSGKPYKGSLRQLITMAQGNAILGIQKLAEAGNGNPIEGMEAITAARLSQQRPASPEQSLLQAMTAHTLGTPNDGKDPKSPRNTYDKVPSLIAKLSAELNIKP